MNETKILEIDDCCPRCRCPDYQGKVDISHLGDAKLIYKITTDCGGSDCDFTREFQTSLE